MRCKCKVQVIILQVVILISFSTCKRSRLKRDESNISLSNGGSSISTSNIAKTLLLSHLHMNRTEPDTRQPEVQHNCTTSLCLFNLLTQSLRPELADDVVTTPTPDSNPERVEPTDPTFTSSIRTKVPTDRPQSTTFKPRQFNYDPNQESNIQPVQAQQSSTTSTSTKESDEMASQPTSKAFSTTSRPTHDPFQESNVQRHIPTTSSRLFTTTLKIFTTTPSTSEQTTTKTTQSTTFSTTSSTTMALASTAPSSTSVTESTGSSTTISITPFINFIPPSVASENKTTTENYRNTSPGISWNLSKGSSNQIKPWQFAIPGSEEKASTGDKLTTATRLRSRCGLFPACHVQLTENKSEYFMKDLEHIGNDITKDLMLKLAISIEVECNQRGINGIIAFNIILIVLIVASNAIIFFVTCKSKALRKPHGYFKLSLAAADALTGLITLPSMTANTIRYFSNHDEYSTLVNQTNLKAYKSEAIFFGVVAILSQVLTMYSILLLSIDSYLSIRWPLKYSFHHLMTPKRAAILITITWSFAVVVSALPIVAHNYVEYGLLYITMGYTPILKYAGPEDGKSFGSYTQGIVYIAMVWGVPFIATWVLTISTAIHGRSMLKAMENGTRRVSVKKMKDLNNDIVITVIIVLSLFTITALPSFIVLIVNAGNSNPMCIERAGSDFIFAAIYILICGSFMNVFVYNFFNHEFRAESRAIFKSMLSRCCPKLYARFFINTIQSQSTKTTKSGRSRISNNKNNNHSKVPEAATNSSLFRPKTIGSSLPDSNSREHDVYYTKIIGIENPGFEMARFNANRNQNNNNSNEFDDVIAPRSVSSSTIETIPGNPPSEAENVESEIKTETTQENRPKPNNTEQTSFATLPSDANCIEYTI